MNNCKLEQEYTSKDTNVNTINKVYKKYDFKSGSNVLDYGGGKYNTNTIFMKPKGVNVYVYDKYNRTPEHNKKVMEAMRKNPPNYIVCSNVLNVIKEEEIVEYIIKDIASIADDHTIILIQIYEGNKTGIGNPTTKGYQRNQKTKDYLSMLKKYLNIIKTDHNIIICKSIMSQTKV